MRTAAAEMDADVDRQILAIDENREVVASLEQQHDSMMQTRRELTAGSDGSMVSGDELAASFQKYLAEMDDTKDTQD
jgi:hypothetical protein